jgi:hypothetical protein
MPARAIPTSGGVPTELVQGSEVGLGGQLLTAALGSNVVTGLLGNIAGSGVVRELTESEPLRALPARTANEMRAVAAPGLDVWIGLNAVSEDLVHQASRVAAAEWSVTNSQSAWFARWNVAVQEVECL